MDKNTATLAKELREVAEQLKFLEAKLTSPRTSLSGGQYYLDGQRIEMEALAELKAALDHARHSVWALLESVTGYSGHNKDEILREYRMQRASELLHALRQHIQSPVRPETPAARSFFDEVQVVADLALRRHMRP
jgi:hypothetical protein